MCLPLPCIYYDKLSVSRPHLSLTLISYPLQFIPLQKRQEGELSACGGSAGCHWLIDNEHGACKCRDAAVCRVRETSVPATPSLIGETFWVWLLIIVSPATPCILLTSFSQAVRLARLRRNHRFPNCICACTERKKKKKTLNTGWSDLYWWWRMLRSILC